MTDFSPLPLLTERASTALEEHSAERARLLAERPRRSLNSKLARLMALVGLPLVLGILVLVWAGVRLDTVAEVSERERVLFNQLTDLRFGLLNAETGLRGYALTQDPTFLEPYTVGSAQIQEILNALEPSQRVGPGGSEVAVALVSRDIRAFLSDWAEPGISLIRSSDTFDARLQRVLFSDGKRRLDAIRQSLTAIDQAANMRRTAARLSQNDLSRLVLTLAWILLALAALTLYLLFRNLSSLVVRPVMQLTEATLALEQGQLGARAPVQSDDELGMLARTFNRAFAALEAQTETLRRQSEALERSNQDLERSNAELEQFAYVASHDLQEPLRMVSSYTQLLEKRYKGTLDPRADQYIHYAVDGANRMQRLIQDLLAFSRVGTQPIKPEAVDSRAVLAEVLASLELSLRDCGGTVEQAELPSVCADRRQLGQVLQNLLTNALKFRREGVPPRVRIWAEPLEGSLATQDGSLLLSGRTWWRFSVADNGIGIEQDYFERIFAIFQRLHSKQEFSGSGIGLSIVKKIIERHGGQLWLESVEGQGTTFHFTLPGAAPLAGPDPLASTFSI